MKDNSHKIWSNVNDVKIEKKNNIVGFPLYYNNTDNETNET